VEDTSLIERSCRMPETQFKGEYWKDGVSDGPVSTRETWDVDAVRGVDGLLGSSVHGASS
jgi:hypothetical protein